MTAEQLAELRVAIEQVVRQAFHGAGPRVQAVVQHWTGGLVDNGTRLEQGLYTQASVSTDDRTPAGERPPLDPGQQLGLSVLLKDDAVIPQVLADFLLDAGHEYATAVAEAARKDERERIAVRLQSEAAHCLSRRPDPDDAGEFAAAVLHTIAEDLLLTTPPAG